MDAAQPYITILGWLGTKLNRIDAVVAHLEGKEGKAKK